MKKKIMRKLLAGVLSATIVLACTGCSQKETKEENNSIAIVNNLQQASASTDGALLCRNGVIYYADAEKGASTPLCTKANCTHTSLQECTANYGKDSGAGMVAFFYEKKLYVLVNDELSACKFYVADQNGQNRKEITKLDYSVSGETQMIVKDGVVIAVLTKNESNDNTGEVTSLPILVSIELKNGKTTELVAPLKQYRAEISLHSLEDDKAYYSFSYWDEKKEVVDKCADPATTMEEIKELMKTSAHTFAGFLSVDGNSGQEYELNAADAPDVVFMDKDNIYLTKGMENALYKLRFGETEAKKDATWNEEMSFIDGRMIYGDRSSEKAKFHTINFKEDGKASDFEAPSDSLFTAVIGENLYYTYMPKTDKEGAWETEIGVVHLK